jgi:hypothetical protein
VKREVLIVAAVALVAALGVMFALLGGELGEDSAEKTPTAIVAPSRTGETTPTYAPQHARLGGPYHQGIVSTITDEAIGLVDEDADHQYEFVIPPDLRPRIDFDHLRADASGGVPFRIYYRKAGDQLIMRGFTHPRRGGRLRD